MNITNRQALELRYAVQRLSQTNKETGFQVYDLGFPLNMALATAELKLRPALAKVDAEIDRVNREIQDLAKTKVDPKPNGDPKQAIAANEAIFEKQRDLRAKADRMLDEKFEVDIPTVKRSEVVCKGATPGPDVLAALSVLIHD